MKKFFSIIIVLSFFCLFLVNRENEKMIIVYSSMESFRGDSLQELLNEEFPDLNVRIIYTPTGKSAAKLSVEGTQTDADIIVGLETGYMFKVLDSMAELPGISPINYVDGFESEIFQNKAVIWERYGGSFIINEKMLEKYDLPIPRTYDDLLNPIYKDKIAMPDPKSSGTGYFFYKALVNQRGEEKALEYFDALHQNIKQFTESGSGPIKLLNQGEIVVAMGMTFQGVNEVNNGMPFKIIFPEEGSPYNTTATAIVKGKEQDPDILKVYEFIINQGLVNDKEKFTPEQIYVDQENNVPNYPLDIDYSNMDGIHSLSEKERLLKLWKY